LKSVACEPKFDVICLSEYDIKNYSFYTKPEDEKCTMHNGVMVVSKSMYFSSSKDKHLVMTLICYFGVIEKYGLLIIRVQSTYFLM